MIKFWMCYCPERGRATKQHDTIEAAQEEAARIASKENQVVYVMEAIGYSKRQEVPTNYTQL